MSDPQASRQPRGFRAQRRFSYPAQVIPLEWTAPTPPHGFPAQPADGLPAQPADEFLVQPVDGLPAQPADGLPAQPADEFPVQPVDEFLVQPADEFPVQSVDDEVELAPSADDAASLEDLPLPPLEFVALPSFTPPADTAFDSVPDSSPPADEPPADAAPDPSTRLSAKGWRRWVHASTLGAVHVGQGAKATRHETMTALASRPLNGCYRIAVLSLKGGVGKTTVTATLGATLASIRDDRVIAVDANPDRGTLSQKVPLETASTVRHLLRDAEGIGSYEDARKYTSRGTSRLEVLASESDPAVSEAFSAHDYDQALAVLERFYNLVLTDCGTGLLHSAMSSVLSSADLLVVVSSGSVDGARSASATLDWLDAHGHEQLVRGAVAVVNAVRPRSGRVDLRKVDDHFARRCRAVVHVPFDPHLEAGAEIDLARLKGSTRDALLELASVVAGGFPAPTTTRLESP